MPGQSKLWTAIENFFVGHQNIYDPNYDPASEIHAELTKLGVSPHTAKKIIMEMPQDLSDKQYDAVSGPTKPGLVTPTQTGDKYAGGGKVVGR